MIFQVGNYLFNSSHIRNVRGADGCDSGLYVSYTNGNVQFFNDISLDEFVQALKRERLIL